MIEKIYRTSDGKDYKNKQDAIDYETHFQRTAYDGALAQYHYFRFSDHRVNVQLYLRYKHMSLEEFKKLNTLHSSYSNTQARKKLWELRTLYKNRVKEGEQKIKESKLSLQQCIAKIKRDEAMMKKL